MTTPFQRLQPAVRRQQLIDVALELFAHDVYDAVGLEDVAAKADVQRSLLYRYFPGGKSDLYLAVVQEAYRRLVAHIDTDPERPIDSKLPANVATFLALNDARDPAVRISAQARRIDEPRVRAVVRDARRDWADRIAANNLPPEEVTPVVMAVLTGYLTLAEILMEEWLVHRSITREQVESALEGALPRLVELSRNL